MIDFAITAPYARTMTAMNKEEIWRGFDALSPEAQQQVADFIAFLQSRIQQGRGTKTVRGKPARPDLAHEPFVGLWRDRDDMQDTRAWIRDVRTREWG